MELKELNYFKVLSFFIRNPYEKIHFRALSLKLNLPLSTIKKYTDILIKDNLITEAKKGRLRIFQANMNSLFFKYLKIALNVKKIEDSGIINFLTDKIPVVSSIVLFGSLAKGEDDEKSDVDLLVIGQRSKELDLSRFEKILEREIMLTVLKWSEWKRKAKEDKAFYLDVITSGIAIYGELPVIE